MQPAAFYRRRVTDPRHRSVDIYGGREVQETLDVPPLKRIHQSPVCAFFVCVCVCFVLWLCPLCC